MSKPSETDGDYPDLYAEGSESPSPGSADEALETSESTSMPKTALAQPESSSLSYSAQIAKQFSQYRQTPSQERQQRVPQISSTLEPSSSTNTMQPSNEAASNGASEGISKPLRPSDMKDEGKLFIGGLNWDTTDESLRNYFSQFGKVEASLIMRDAEGRSRGFAFLTFEDPTSVNAVIARDHVLDGKQIDPKRAIPREEHLRNTRYFVGGLSATTTSESMRDFFSAYGKVVDATVMVDRETGRSKGFGFITFEDSSNSEQFVGKLGLVLDDKQIEVKMAQPRSQRDSNRAETGREPYTDRDAHMPNMSMPLLNAQQPSINPMSLLYQRSMGQMPLLPAAGMMGMNPLALGMSAAFNPMMGMGMSGIGGVNANSMGGMGGVGVGMRMGMGPMGMVPGAMMSPAGVAGMFAGMGNIPMRMRQGMGMNGALARSGGMNDPPGPGPARAGNRGQYNYHPYAR